MYVYYTMYVYWYTVYIFYYTVNIYYYTVYVYYSRPRKCCAVDNLTYVFFEIIVLLTRVNINYHER